MAFERKAGPQLEINPTVSLQKKIMNKSQLPCGLDKLVRNNNKITNSRKDNYHMLINHGHRDEILVVNRHLNFIKTCYYNKFLLKSLIFDK